MTELKVLIVGAGLGGLCLAQALRRQGAEVQVFERDRSPWDRPQGYRLHIDSDGINALYNSLSPDLFRLFDATSMRALPFTTIVDTALSVQRRTSHDEHSGTQEPHSYGGLPAHVNVNRATLRQILLSGLDEVIHFDKKLVRYESGENGVATIFEDGFRAEGNLLVGADGIRSTVRRQRIPDAQIQDTGVRAIYGRIPFADALKVVPQQAREDVFTVAVDSRKLFLGLGPVVFPMRPEAAAAQYAPQAVLRPQDDYVVCILGGRKELFARDDNLRALSGKELQQICGELLLEWPEGTQAIPAHGDPDSFFFVEMHTSVPCEMPLHPNVTLLGDAIHAMTPTLGRGANLAMHDAALLARHLATVIDGSQALSGALGAYEDEMTRYGFDVVRKSAATGVRLMGQEPLPTAS